MNLNSALVAARTGNPYVFKTYLHDQVGGDRSKAEKIIEALRLDAKRCRNRAWFMIALGVISFVAFIGIFIFIMGVWSLVITSGCQNTIAEGWDIWLSENTPLSRPCELEVI